ncbi:hypothetical protein [Bacteroides heparinolyticus]|uniref:hypothetical protein n=1 Tax=Prevotella heparinolytica TaxID=28113 RepID=UPI0035A0987B
MIFLKLFGVTSDGELLGWLKRNPHLERSKELIEIMERYGIPKEKIGISGGGNAVEDGRTITGESGMTIDEIMKKLSGQWSKDCGRTIIQGLGEFLIFAKVVL